MERLMERMDMADRRILSGAVLLAVVLGLSLPLIGAGQDGNHTNATAPTPGPTPGEVPGVATLLAGLLLGGGATYGMVRWRLGPAYRLVVDVAAAVADKKVDRAEARRIALDVVDALYGEEEGNPDGGRSTDPSP